MTSSVSSTTSSTTSTTSTSTSSTTSTSSSDYLSFDTEALVEAKLASRYERLDKMETTVTETETKIAAYEDMQGLLQDVVDTLEALRSNPANQDDDVFLDRTAYLSSSTTTDAGTYMSATVDEGTDLGSHTIEISQVATANIVKSAAQTTKSDDLAWSGVITLGTNAGGSADITITATMSLADMADAINTQTTNTGVVASVMKVSDTSYILVLTTENTGETITASDKTGTLLSGSSYLGILDNGAVDSDNVLQKAQNAILTVDGVNITRSSNDIDDLLEGITLHLYSAPTADTTLTLEVDNDLTGIEEAVSAFVEAYNLFRDFVLTNQTTSSDGTATDDAVLFSDSTLRSISQKVQSILSSGIDETSLATLGVTFDEDNKLVLDTTTLDNALLDDFDAVEALFAYTMTTSSGDLGLVRHTDSSLSFTLKLAYDSDGDMTASIGGDSSLFTVTGSSGGWTIEGVEGTEYEGLTMVYTGTTEKSITVELSQGIADQLYTAIDDVSNSKGTLSKIITSLEDGNTALETRISALESSTSSYSEYLYSAYSTIAANLAAAQTTLDLLEALLNADSSS